MRRASFVVVALVAATARGDPFPARTGESGLLDVPDAEVRALGSIAVSGELSVRDGRDPGESVSPVRLALVTGLGHHLEAGLAVREEPVPGTARAAALFAAALKLGLWAPRGAVPGVALDATLERANLDPVGALRLVTSSGPVGPLRVSGYAGAFARDIGARPAASGGVAASLRAGRLELVAELASGADGRLVGGALRWMISPSLGVTAGATWFPRSGVKEGTLGVALAASTPRPVRAERQAPATREELVPAAPAPAKRFPTDRPRFPVRNRPAGAGEDAR